MEISKYMRALDPRKKKGASVRVDFEMTKSPESKECWLEHILALLFSILPQIITQFLFQKFPQSPDFLFYHYFTLLL